MSVWQFTGNPYPGKQSRTFSRLFHRGPHFADPGMFSRAVVTARMGLVMPSRRGTSRLLPTHTNFNVYIGQRGPSKPGKKEYPMTKITATIGPVSEQKGPLERLVREGITCMRLNFSHATLEEAQLRETNLRNAPGKHRDVLGENYNLRAILLDTQGPEIRTGSIKGGGTVDFVTGHTVLLTNRDEFKENSTAEVMYVTYPNLGNVVANGTRILLQDGEIGLTVQETHENGDVTCLVENNGTIKSKRGVNIPNVPLGLPPMSLKDRKDVTYAVERDFDFVACSFVKSASDVAAIKNFIAWQMEDMWPRHHLAPKVIAKIETAEAVSNFEEILEEADGIMVARGDLGVEIPMEQLANVQKEIVRLCNQAGKPVIVATQMLDSMQKNPRPTRAEVSDVTNAIYDGADSVMLSGETANGKFPIESVQVMTKIVLEAEKWHRMQTPHHHVRRVSQNHPQSKEEAIAASAVVAAHETGASCIVVLTNTGKVARLVAAQRPMVPVVCLVSSEKLGRQLSLHRGLFPLKSTSAIVGHYQKDEGVQLAKKAMFCAPGDRIVVVSMDPIRRREDDVCTSISANSSIALHILEVRHSSSCQPSGPQATSPLLSSLISVLPFERILQDTIFCLWPVTRTR
eukprot:g63390.t1